MQEGYRNPFGDCFTWKSKFVLNFIVTIKERNDRGRDRQWSQMVQKVKQKILDVPES